MCSCFHWLTEICDSFGSYTPVCTWHEYINFVYTIPPCRESESKNGQLVRIDPDSPGLGVVYEKEANVE